MVCVPDSQLQVRQGLEDKAASVWATASRTHLNRDFTFGSQALAVSFTVRESMGGRVWPNVIFEDTRLDHAFTVWGNSTLGLLQGDCKVVRFGPSASEMGGPQGWNCRFPLSRGKTGWGRFHHVERLRNRPGGC